MRVLLLGATGFIGSALVARLARDGHGCVTMSRGAAPPLSIKHFRRDIGRMIDEEDWADVLESVDAVVNAAGALQGPALHDVHATGVTALYQACTARGVRRVIHLSAVGVDRETPSEFSATKRDGERALTGLDLDWVVLRPSVVIGRAAYGGSALLRGLASLPVLPVLPDTAPIQPVHLDDVIETVSFFLKPQAPAKIALDLVGPDRMSFSDAVRMFGTWLRLPPVRQFAVPRWLAGVLYAAGDVIRALGWATPVSSTAREEMRRGAIGDPAEWSKTTGIAPRSIKAALDAEPASVQERWFARLYVRKPFVFGIFALFWLSTGIVSLGPGWEQGMNLMREGGAGEQLAALTVVAGALADIAIGLAILYRPLSRYGLWAAIAITLVYVVLGTVLVPRLWTEPLGPMLKIWPILVLNFVALAIREDR